MPFGGFQSCAQEDNLQFIAICATSHTRMAILFDGKYSGYSF